MDKLDIYVYTDIKGIRKAKGSYIWLIEMQTQKTPVTLWDKKETEAVTGRIAELQGLIQALGRTTRSCEIILHISNENLYNVFQNGWLEAWSSSGWKDCKGEPVKDAEKWSEFYQLLKKHTLLGVSKEHHSYSSWMQNQLGDSKGESSEDRLKGSYETIRKFKELIESLDMSDFEESAELQTLINGVCETLFRKFRISQMQTKTDSEKSENPESLINGVCRGGYINMRGE